MIEQPTVLQFSSYHLRPDPEIHEAGYGARLIYDEVMQGGRGVVYDRQSVFGDQMAVEKQIFPVLDRAYERFRKMANGYRWHGSGENGRFTWREGRVIVVMSPQGSYGYLYVSALLEHEDHYTESRPIDLPEPGGRGRAASDEGNWPVSLVERDVRAIEEDLEWSREHGSKARVRELEKKLKAVRGDLAPR